MYLVLELTNGEGYSSPRFSIHSSKIAAMDEFAEMVGYNIINKATLDEDNSTDTKKLFFDGEDNFGVHLIELKDDYHHVIDIETCYVDVLSVRSYKSKSMAKKKYSESKAELLDVSEEENSWEAYTVSGDTNDGSAAVLLIFKKK